MTCRSLKSEIFKLRQKSQNQCKFGCKYISDYKSQQELPSMTDRDKVVMTSDQQYEIETGLCPERFRGHLASFLMA